MSASADAALASEAAKEPPRAKAITAEPAMLAYSACLTVHKTMAQQLLFGKYCDRYYGADAARACTNTTITDANFGLQDSTSHMVFYGIAATVFPSIIVCAYLGAIGDRRGRKYPIIVPLVGAALAYALSALQAHFVHWDPLWSLLSSFLLGVSGYITASLQTCFSYLTAAVRPQERTKRIAVAEIGLLLAVVVGSFSVGPLVQSLGLDGTYALLAAVNLLAAAYCIAWLDDSRPSPPRPRADSANQPALAASEGGLRLFSSLLRDYFRCVLKKRPGSTAAYIRAALAAYLLSYCSSDGSSDVLYLYLTKVHGFSTSLYGYYTGVLYGSRVVVGGAGLLCLRRWFDVHDLTVALWGALSGAVAYGVLGVAVQPWMAWLAAALNSLQVLYAIGARSFISKAVPDDEQGRMFAFVATSQSLFTFLSSLLFSNVYPQTLPFYPGLCFVIAALLSIAAVAVLAFTANHVSASSRCVEMSSGTCIDYGSDHDHRVAP